MPVSDASSCIPALAATGGNTVFPFLVVAVVLLGAGVAVWATHRSRKRGLTGAGAVLVALVLAGGALFAPASAPGAIAASACSPDVPVTPPTAPTMRVSAADVASSDWHSDDCAPDASRCEFSVDLASFVQTTGPGFDWSTLQRTGGDVAGYEITQSGSTLTAIVTTRDRAPAGTYRVADSGLFTNTAILNFPVLDPFLVDQMQPQGEGPWRLTWTPERVDGQCLYQPGDGEPVFDVDLAERSLVGSSGWNWSSADLQTVLPGFEKGDGPVYTWSGGGTRVLVTVEVTEDGHLLLTTADRFTLDETVALSEYVGLVGGDLRFTVSAEDGTGTRSNEANILLRLVTSPPFDGCLG